MMLSLPETAFFKKRHSFLVQMWPILLFESAPYLMALIRCQLRIFINNLLKFIHHTPIRNKTDGILQLHLTKLRSGLSKKQFHPWICEKLHRHGMCLCRLHRNIPMLPDIILSCQISLKSVAAFMGDHIHITACPVKISKDQWHSR